MLNSLISSPTIQMLEQTLSFTEQRHQILLNDIANADTPGFVAKDASVAEFQKSLQDEIARQQANFAAAFSPESSDSITFTPNSTGDTAVTVKPTDAPNSVPFHDRGVRNMEYLMSQLADNALSHNMVAQLLKSHYDTVGRAISMRV